MIPLVAIQMKALKVGNNVGLVFTTVVDQMPLGLVDEDEEVQETTDRSYWEQRSSKKTVTIADELLELARIHDRSLELKYNKFYIGLSKGGRPSNFVIFRPKKEFLRFEPRLKSTSETQEFLSSAGLDVMDYDSRWGRYRIRLQPADMDKSKKILAEVVARAFAESNQD